MNPQTKALIKERLLAGYVTAEIAKDLPRLRKGSAGVYTSQVRAELTSHEQEVAKKAKSARRYTRATNAATRVSLSDVHWKIGMRISRLRNEKLMTVEEFSKAYNFGTRNTISTMECGQHDFTLLEIMELSKILNISVGDLAKGSF